MNQLKLGDLKIDLYFNVAAANRIAERCGGDISDITTVFDGLSEAKALTLICGILCDLANGAVVKRNAEISLGLATGEPKKEYTAEMFEALADTETLTKSVELILATMNKGSEFEVPENAETVEEDIDLKELEAERNKEKKS